jgi:glycerophosphoryl diester phosphodiesterase
MGMLEKAAIYKIKNLNIPLIDKKIRYIAHRGLSGIAPENTIPAYVLAGGKYWGAECDIMTTADDEWVLMHDDTVDRTTDGSGTVISKTLAEIMALTVDYGNNIATYPGLKVPTFEEYLFTCKKFNLVPVIEIKYSSATETNISDLVNKIKLYNFENDCIIISFYLTILQYIRKYSENIKIQYLTSITETNINICKELKKCGIDTDSLSKTNVESCHSNGIEVNVWTVDVAQTAKTYIGYGTDYITTNKLIEVL